MRSWCSWTTSSSDVSTRSAARLSTNRSALLRRGALAVLEAVEAAAADGALQEAYRRQPPDPLLVQAAVRLAAETAPPW